MANENRTPPFEGYETYADLDPFEDSIGPFWFHKKKKKAAMRVKPNNCNSMGITHGGAVREEATPCPLFELAISRC